MGEAWDFSRENYVAEAVEDWIEKKFNLCNVNEPNTLFKLIKGKGHPISGRGGLRGSR